MSEIDWQTWNDRVLQAALDRVRRHVARLAADAAAPAGSADHAAPPEGLAPPALEVIRGAFDLSPFECDLLVLAAAPELDPGFAALAAAAQGDPERRYPTFALAFAALPAAHWSALSPAGPLRRWRLVEVAPGGALTLSPLRIEERVLHFLRGIEAPDERLAGLVTALETGATLVPSHRLVAERLAAAWARQWGQGPLPVIQLVGEEAEGKRAIAAAACAALGIGVNVLRATSLPAADAELEGLLRLLGREAALGRRALLLDCEGEEPADAARSRAVATFAEGYHGVLVLASRERRHLPRRASVPLDVARPETAEQEALWRAVLGENAERFNGHCRTLAAQFDLSAGAIRAAGAEALGRVETAAEAGEEAGPEALAKALWRCCLGQARPSLDALAQRLRPIAGWDDLVLPEAQKALLSQIAIHVRRRHRVYEEWGFAGRTSRGLGITALFAGVSGTGKTMAAEVLARELDLDLYRIDLASVVSKYIGETEKNLKRVFDAAEAGGAILLFDEADALFGRRSEVKDSHDRYANIEVSYLLQRMEQYRGLAILTTNMKTALDPAFLRRLRFTVQFPFPDAAARAEIWRRIFPPQTPTAGLEAAKLARLGVAGGNIANIALAAAFLAAEGDEPVGMGHVLKAARSEYAKLEKPLTTGEIGSWEP
ncbi:MAG TPA: ATP-binding protein [Thermoanaerobaculia bacterium]